MKARIIGSIIVLLIVGGLYVVSEGGSNTTQQTTPTIQPSANDSAFKNLNIN